MPMVLDRFLEYGEYKGNLYGTSIESVKDLLNSGKICVIDIEPNVNTSHRVNVFELEYNSLKKQFSVLFLA